MQPKVSEATTKETTKKTAMMKGGEKEEDEGKQKPGKEKTRRIVATRANLVLGQEPSAVGSANFAGGAWVRLATSGDAFPVLRHQDYIF